ncbi:MAG: hypothetical protein HY791_05265 [Deltaproteobacteria bacterium]|nr:hypothetical protein [Deltaproteobacteria bacterium]
MRRAIALLSLSTLLSACKSDDTNNTNNNTPSASQVERYCSRQCAKLASCNFLIGTEAACVSDCKSNATTGSSTCNPPASAVDLCLSKLESATCTELMTAAPAECESLCPASDGGVGRDATSNADATASTPECQELQTCCPTLPGVVQAGCDTVARLDNSGNCMSALDGYKQGGFCGGFPDAGEEPDSGDEIDSGPAADTGVHPDATTPVDSGPGADGSVSSACDSLSDCCTRITIPAIKQGCETVVGLGMADTCQSTLDNLVGAGSC